jgi:hypothetical protein
MCACKYHIREERHTAKNGIARKLSISLGTAQSNVHVHLDYIRVCVQFALRTAHQRASKTMYLTRYSDRRAQLLQCTVIGDRHATTIHGVTSQEIQSKAISKQHHSDSLWDHKVCFFWISWAVATLCNCWALLFCARRVTVRHLSHAWTTEPRRRYYSR